MDTDDIIVLGDKVELLLEDNNIYRTRIEDLTDTGLLLVALPSIGGVPAPLYIDDKISLSFYRETGRYIATVEVVAFENQGDARFVWLLQVAAPHRQQRRGDFRLPARLDVTVCEYIDGLERDLPLYEEIEHELATLKEKASTKDISVTGVALKSNREYEYGEKYLLKVFLDGKQPGIKPFLVCAEVMRSSQTEESRINFIGMRYYGAANNRSEVLSRYLFAEQLKIMRNRRYD